MKKASLRKTAEEIFFQLSQGTTTTTTTTMTATSAVQRRRQKLQQQQQQQQQQQRTEQTTNSKTTLSVVFDQNLESMLSVLGKSLAWKPRAWEEL